MEDLPSIIQGCLNNDQQHQKMLYHKYYGYALKTVFRYIYHYDRAVDVVNDGFVKIFRSINKFVYPDQIDLEKVWMGWVKRIMVNTAIDELRKNRMMPEIGGIPDQVWDRTDTSQAADQTILYKELIYLIKQLSPSYRTVFNMYVIDGFSHQEIAAQLGIAVGTSKSNLAKAKMHLKKTIEAGKIEAEVCSL